MHVSEKGRAFIGQQEGLRLKAYRDSVGVLTIGYGHSNNSGLPPHIEPGMTISRAQADQILAADLVRYEEQVLREVKAPLTQCQFDALVSFTYNCGEGSLRSVVTMAHGGPLLFPTYMLHFNRAGGRILPALVRRRKAEAAMFQGRYPLVLQVKLAAKKVLAEISTNHPLNEDDETA